MDVAAIGEEDAVDVVCAEEIIVLGGIFPSFGGIDGHPAYAIEIKFGPAVVAGDVALGFAFGERETHFEACRNAGGTHHADEKGMEVGAVTALGGASPDGVAAAPAFAGFIVAHGGDDVLVNVASFLDLSGVARSVLLGEAGDGATEGHEFVGLKVTVERGIGGRDRRVVYSGASESNFVFVASGGETKSDVEAGSGLLRRGLKFGESVLVLGVAALRVGDGAIDVQAAHFLIAIGLRQGNPEANGSAWIFCRREMNLVGEFEGARGYGCGGMRTGGRERVSGVDEAY